MFSSVASVERPTLIWTRASHWIAAVARKKEHLPSKVCLMCSRPFSWRKKWERCWEQVRYCSGACRKNRGARPRS